MKISAPEHPAAVPSAVELRIHGVGGSTPQALLGEAHEHAVVPVPPASPGDDRCRVWARRADPKTQGFRWGPLTSESPWQALWIVLFPFTLLNAAGWMHRPVTGKKDRTVTAVRVVVHVLGLLLTAVWVLWLGVIVVDLLAHQAARSVGFPPPAVRAALATALVAAVMLVFYGVAHLTHRSFEHRRPTAAAASGSAGPRRRVGSNESLSSPSFFDHPDESARLLFEHAGVIAVVTTLVGWRAVSRAGGAGSLQYGGGITALVAVQFALLGALFLLTTFPVDWRRGWRVAGPAVAATIAVMLSNGFFAGVALFARKSLSLDEVPAGSEMAFLDVYTVVVLVTLLGTVVGWAVPFFLGRDDAGDVPAEHRAEVGRRRRIARAFRHVDLPLSAGAVGMLVAGAAVGIGRIDPSGWNPWDWSVATGGPVRWAETIGAKVLPAAALAVPALVRKAARSGATRRNVGNLWDVLSFWPRRFHPLAVRPYTERAVPILQEHIVALLKVHSRVVISAHSQGSVLAYAALSGLQPPDRSDGSWRERVHLVTYGSPLSRLHARFFPHYFRPEDYVNLRQALGSWHNFYRLTDHIGQAVFDPTDVPDPCDHVLADPAVPQLKSDRRARSGPAPPPLEHDRPPGAGVAGHNDYRCEPLLKAHVRRCRQGKADNPPPPPDPGFRPRRRMVSWFDPRLLAMTGFNAVSAEFFRTYLDKREIETLLTKADRTESPEAGKPVRVDYVADLGDAFDPTYAIAWHLAKKRLKVRDESGGGTLNLDRGGFLIMGGDQVYPAPTAERYRNQTVGPYSVALPRRVGDDGPQLLALPGNHDWYDGLTLFLQQFCTEERIGGWRTPQARSYFAVRLRPGWWLWGVDAGLAGQVDSPQREFFLGLDVAPGSNIILCWSAPTWTKERRKPGGHALLQRFVSDVVQGDKHQSAVALYLTGDTHHFAHYQSADTGEHWITAGGGGAFLHPTHNLRRSFSLPAPDGGTTTLALQACWPEKRKSRRRLAGLVLFPWHNRSFAAFMAMVHVLLAWAVQGGLREPTEGWADALRDLTPRAVRDGFVRSPVAIVLGLLVVAGFTALAIPPRREKRHRFRIPGAVHGALHVAVALGVIIVASNRLTFESDGLFTVAFLAAVAAGGALSGVLVGIYLAVTNLTLKMHDNEAFSALHLTGYKHFLRMEVLDHKVVVRVVGLEKVGRRWRREPATADRPPCGRPSAVEPICVRTIEVPARTIVIPEPTPVEIVPPAAPSTDPSKGRPPAEDTPEPPVPRPGWSMQPCEVASPLVEQPVGRQGDGGRPAL